MYKILHYYETYSKFALFCKLAFHYILSRQILKKVWKCNYWCLSIL